MTTDELHEFLHRIVRKVRESEVNDYSLVAELVEELRHEVQLQR